MKPVCVNICILILTVVALTHQAIIVEKPLTGGDVIQGNCANTRETDRVFYDHVDKMAIPLTVRTETEKYDGNKIIYCVQALNQKSNSGSAVITKGGVNYSSVTVELKSSRGHGLEYYVSVYAN